MTKFEHFMIDTLLICVGLPMAALFLVWLFMLITCAIK